MTLSRPKRIAAIHDLSSFGRCALSVIIPALSVLGHQVCPLPTALLSTHTGGFSDMAALDCTDFPKNAAAHLKKCGVEFECIYSGYLADPSQAIQIADIKAEHPDALLVVDPVLGDDGALYSGIGEAHVTAMRELIKHAGLITPNATEAKILLGEDMEPADMLSALSGLGKTDVIITGIDIEGNGKCNILSSGGEKFLIPCEYFDCSYPGTGDIFTSVTLGGIMNGLTLKEAAGTATGFVEICISLTMNSGEPTRDGVFLEHTLSLLGGLDFEKEIIIL